MWSALPKKAIDNTVKDYHHRLTSGMCVSQQWTFWTLNALIHLTDTDCYT